MLQTFHTIAMSIALIGSSVCLLMTPRIARNMAGEYPNGSYGFWAWRTITACVGLMAWTGFSLADMPGEYVGQVVMFVAFLGPYIMGYHLKVPQNVARTDASAESFK